MDTSGVFIKATKPAACNTSRYLTKFKTKILELHLVYVNPAE
jgi:hypothetical protein